jgi:hypothetical protein
LTAVAGAKRPNQPTVVVVAVRHLWVVVAAVVA